MKRIRIVRCNCGRPGCESFYFDFGTLGRLLKWRNGLSLRTAADYETIFAGTDVNEMIEALQAFKAAGYKAQ